MSRCSMALRECRFCWDCYDRFFGSVNRIWIRTHEGITIRNKLIRISLYAIAQSKSGRRSRGNSTRILRGCPASREMSPRSSSLTII